MAFTDPQSVTFDSISKSLNRIATTGSKSVYKTSDGEFMLTISHTDATNRVRRMVRLDRTIIAEEPLTGNNAYAKGSVYVVVEDPQFGMDDSALLKLIAAFTAWFTAGNQAKVLGDET